MTYKKLSLRGGLRLKLTWLQIASLVIASLAPAFLPSSAFATTSNQLVSRKVTIDTSKPANTNGTWTVNFTTSATGPNTIGSIRFEICDDPIPAVTCAQSTSAGAAFTSTSTIVTTGLGTTSTGTIANAGSGTNNRVTYNTFAGTPTAVAANTAISVAIPGTTNPTGANKTFFIRISLYDATGAGGTAADYGSVASSTASQIVVQGDVKETLTFCVYAQGATCASPGTTTVDLGTPLGGALSSSSTGFGTSQMEATTNANSGYVIQYLATPLTGPAQTLPASSTTVTGITSTTGSEQFAINATGANTGVTNSAAPSGGSGTAATNYTTANQYSFVGNAATTIASAAGVTAKTTFTVSYIANIAAATKPGRYSTTFTYVCTPTY